MSSEPRMRGTRFRRPSTKKHSKERRGEPEASVSYLEEAPIDPSQISSRILNALEHLGNQRFALPPFSEHFQRWIKDVESVLMEFEAKLPEMADEAYRVTVQDRLSSLREVLGKQVDAEKNSSEETSKILQELNAFELELSKLEHEYRTVTYEARKRHEKALGKLRDEIDSLDKRRLKLLRKQPSIVERILHRSSEKLEASTSALQSKRAQLDHEGTLLQNNLDELRANYEVKRGRLRARQELLKAKLDEFNRTTSNDALELRKAACQEFGLAVTQAVDRSPKRQITPDTDSNR
jgi:vacuolar-type H+-ATPase subunit I/STV1